MELPHALRRRLLRRHVAIRAVGAIGAITAAVGIALTMAASTAGHARDLEAARAQRLFDEGSGAKASLRGDTQLLPPSVARCAGCHDREGGARAGPPQARTLRAEGRRSADEGASRSTASGAEAAPRLDAATLLEPVARRRGPPSRYDQASFCRLLTTGVDPAGIVVARAMPVYTIDAEQCRTLWRLVAGSAS